MEKVNNNYILLVRNQLRSQPLSVEEVYINVRISGGGHHGDYITLCLTQILTKYMLDLYIENYKTLWRIK